MHLEFDIYYKEDSPDTRLSEAFSVYENLIKTTVSKPRFLPNEFNTLKISYCYSPTLAGSMYASIKRSIVMINQKQISVRLIESNYDEFIELDDERLRTELCKVILEGIHLVYTHQVLINELPEIFRAVSQFFINQNYITQVEVEKYSLVNQPFYRHQRFPNYLPYNQAYLIGYYLEVDFHLENIIPQNKEILTEQSKRWGQLRGMFNDFRSKLDQFIIDERIGKEALQKIDICILLATEDSDFSNYDRIIALMKSKPGWKVKSGTYQIEFRNLEGPKIVWAELNEKLNYLKTNFVDGLNEVEIKLRNKLSDKEIKQMAQLKEYARAYKLEKGT